jgi:hypothetical protein
LIGDFKKLVVSQKIVGIWFLIAHRAMPVFMSFEKFFAARRKENQMNLIDQTNNLLDIINRLQSTGNSLDISVVHEAMLPYLAQLCQIATLERNIPLIKFATSLAKNDTRVFKPVFNDKAIPNVRKLDFEDSFTRNACIDLGLAPLFFAIMNEDEKMIETLSSLGHPDDLNFQSKEVLDLGRHICFEKDTSPIFLATSGNMGLNKSPKPNIIRSLIRNGYNVTPKQPGTKEPRFLSFVETAVDDLFSEFNHYNILTSLEIILSHIGIDKIQQSHKSATLFHDKYNYEYYICDPSDNWDPSDMLSAMHFITKGAREFLPSSCETFDVRSARKMFDARNKRKMFDARNAPKTLEEEQNASNFVSTLTSMYYWTLEELKYVKKQEESAEKYLIEISKLLLKYGAQLNIPTLKTKKLPLDFIQDGQAPLLTKFLENNGARRSTAK